MIPFQKLQGLGNDFVFFRHEDLPDPSQSLIQQICERKLGVGSDGLITIHPQGELAFMRMWNPDGSPSEMCGNGLRCAALWLDLQLGTHCGAQSEHVIQLGGRRHLVRLVGDAYEVRMGLPNFDPVAIGLDADAPWLDFPNPYDGQLGSTTAVSYGNPHWVWFVESLPNDWLELGRKAERHPAFRNRVNVHFVVAESRDRAHMWTWERGAGPTLACGSGACAVAAAGHATGRFDREVTLSLPGGNLQIALTSDDTLMTGPARLVFKGEWASP